MFGLVSINAPNVYRYKPDRQDTRIDPYPAQRMGMQARRDSIRGPNIMSPRGMRGQMISGENNAPSIVGVGKPVTSNLVSPQTTPPGPVISPVTQTAPVAPAAPAAPLGLPAATPAPGLPGQAAAPEPATDVTVPETGETTVEPPVQGGPPIPEGFETTADGGVANTSEIVQDSFDTLTEDQLVFLRRFAENPENYTALSELIPDDADDDEFFNALSSAISNSPESASFPGSPVDGPPTFQRDLADRLKKIRRDVAYSP